MLKTVSFYGSCGARSEVTLCSKPITHPYRTKKIRVKFANGCENLMQLQFMIGADDETPASGKPSGSSLLADYGQVEYVVGNDEVVVMSHEVEVPEGNSYIKVYADNGDYYAHDVVVQIAIESLERR